MRFAVFIVLMKGVNVVFEKEVDVVPPMNEMEHLVLEHGADYVKVDHRYVYEPAINEEVAVAEPVE